MQPDFTVFDTFILGDQSINKMPLMKWANVDLKNLNGHNIKDISNEIQKMIHTERSKWGHFLRKTAYYATTALAVLLLLGEGLAITTGRHIAANYISFDNRGIILIAFSSLSGLFYTLYEINKINTREKVQLEAIKKWRGEMSLTKEWVNDFKECDNLTQLSHLSKRAKDLLNSATEGQKEKITASISKIEAAERIVFNNTYLIKNMSPVSRYIIITLQNGKNC